MASSPRLSIVIPHLNDEDNLARCLASLDAQAEPGLTYEVIVVDNGSKQPPSRVVADHPHARLVVEPIPGPGPARNLGAGLAAAPLIAFIDADCVAEPGWMRSIVAFFDEHPEISFVGGDIDILAVDAAHPTAVESYESIYSYRAQRYIEQEGYAATGNMAVRKSVFAAVGPFGGIGMMEDTEWGQRATRMGYKSAFLAAARVLTPSCRSFRELAVRWDRHVAHEYKAAGKGVAGLAAWMLRSVVIAASPLPEIARVARTSRVTGARQKALAWTCLARIRLHRARRSLELALGKDADAIVRSWNREMA
jgi:glycosyltransferase involved in cell wall biosynthesis